MKPKRWTDVYPYGTKQGDEEAKFFKALARHPKYDYRSTSQLMKETGLSRERIEEIIDKYTSFSPPLIYSHPTNEDHWSYWERCQDRLGKDKRSLSQKDQDYRVDRHLKGSPNLIQNEGDDADSSK
jgi:hypothetical protein